MAIMTEGGPSRDFEPAPAGMHVARCYQVIDLGTQYSDRWDKWSRQVWVAWELPEEWIDYEMDGELIERPQMVSEFYTLSHHEKSNLRKDLESWYGKSFNDADLDAAGGFDMEKVLGRAAMLNIVHVERNGKVYANVNGVNPLPKGMECPEAHNDKVAFSLDEFDEDTFEELSPGIQDMIRKSKEYQAMKGFQEEEPDEVQEPPPVDDSDIPFHHGYSPTGV